MLEVHSINTNLVRPRNSTIIDIMRRTYNKYIYPGPIPFGLGPALRLCSFLVILTHINDTLPQIPARQKFSQRRSRVLQTNSLMLRELNISRADEGREVVDGVGVAVARFEAEDVHAEDFVFAAEDFARVLWRGSASVGKEGKGGLRKGERRRIGEVRTMRP